MGKRMAAAGRWICFLYCLAMLWLLFGQRVGSGDYAGAFGSNMNLKPFSTIEWYWYVLKHVDTREHVRQAVINLAGNVVMFVPLGFFMPLLLPGVRKLFRFLVSAFGIILGIELFQLVTRLGCCDVDDVILNLAGVLMGFSLYKLAELFSRWGRKAA